MVSQKNDLMNNIQKNGILSVPILSSFMGPPQIVPIDSF